MILLYYYAMYYFNVINLLLLPRNMYVWIEENKNIYIIIIKNEGEGKRKNIVLASYSTLSFERKAGKIRYS